jgi:hypothetical protein
MRRRSREVNIFNMSLLDILCGALGAFCFMMIALLPYWRPAGKTAEDIQKQYDKSMQELTELESEIGKVSGNASGLKEKIENLRAQMRSIEQRRQQEARQMEELKKRAERAEEDSFSEPITFALASLGAPADLDLYVKTRGKRVRDQQEMPAADTNVRQGPFFARELYMNCGTGRCTEIWTAGQTGPGIVMELYYKFMESPDGAPATAFGYYMIGNNFFKFPNIIMPKSKTVMRIGEFHFKGSDNVEFIPDPGFEPQFQEYQKTLKKTEKGE